MNLSRLRSSTVKRSRKTERARCSAVLRAYKDGLFRLRLYMYIVKWHARVLKIHTVRRVDAWGDSSSNLGLQCCCRNELFCLWWNWTLCKGVDWDTLSVMIGLSLVFLVRFVFQWTGILLASASCYICVSCASSGQWIIIGSSLYLSTCPLPSNLSCPWQNPPWHVLCHFLSVTSLQLNSGQPLWHDTALVNSLVPRT